MAGYMDRALKAKDPRFARILGKLGYDRRDMVAADDAGDSLADNITSLRAEYLDVVGKKAFHGWSADTLRDKIAEAKG
jgi:hypothetical protein